MYLRSPATGCGTYGSSSRATSSSLSSRSSAATASSRCCGLVAPTIGAVTDRLARSTQASATWAGGTPRASATSATRSTTARSASACRRASGRTSSVSRPRSSSSQSRVSRPRASGLHGMHADALVGAQRQHLALLLAVEQVVVVLHADEAGPAVQRRRVTAPWRTARRTSTTRRCSAPCRPCTTSCSASSVSSIGVRGSQRWIW